MTEITPRIYVASLSDYNAGRLVGKWIDLEGKTKEDVLEEVNEMLKTSKEPIAEEWAIHDFESMPDLGENPDLEKVVAIADAIAEHGEAFLAYAKYQGDCATKKGFEDSYQGQYSNDEKFAQEMAKQCEDIQKEVHWPYTCIDWEHAARELMYDYFEEDGYYFRNS